MYCCSTLMFSDYEFIIHLLLSLSNRSHVFQSPSPIPVHRLYDTSAQQYMYRIGFDIVQQSLVVGNDHSTGFRSLEFVETVGHNTQGIHIQSGIRFVQN